ncbi:MAG: hypothetical protein M3Y41_11540, partial [Pseudomonadota bacterium]|nr:hypothetical protein [Pseudomonadota bacterium]
MTQLTVRRLRGLVATVFAATGAAVAAPTPALARVGVFFGFAPPIWGPPPVYYPPPPVYYPPPPVVYAPPSAYSYTPPPGGGGQSCNAGPYVCPMARP